MQFFINVTTRINLYGFLSKKYFVNALRLLFRLSSSSIDTFSANFRGDMQVCYHQPCDNLETMLTEDNLAFLAKTSDVITSTVAALAECIKCRK